MGRTFSAFMVVTTLWAASAAAQEEKKPSPPTVMGGPEGFVIQSEGGDFKLQVRGYAQFDGRFYPEDDGKLGTNAFLLRRVRPIVQGTVAKYFEFNITPDFGGGSSVLQDAYLDFRYSPKARLRVGKFKGPVGLERLQSATAISFVERALPASFVPNRELGAMLHGELGAGVFAYAIGVFDGAVDGGSVDTDSNDGKDLAGRVFLSPFKRGKSVLKNLGFGISGTTGKQSGALPSYRTGGQLVFFSYATGVSAEGTRTRYSPQLSFYSGPFGLLGEYAVSKNRVSKAPTVATLEHRAWQATASITLTGDDASYGGVKPKKPFDPSKGQWGALELVARANAASLDRDAFSLGLADATKSARKAFAWGVGLNWYLNRNVKQVVSFERTTFTGGAAGGADRLAENALFIRSQVSF